VVVVNGVEEVVLVVLSEVGEVARDEVELEDIFEVEMVLLELELALLPESAK